VEVKELYVEVERNEVFFVVIAPQDSVLGVLDNLLCWETLLQKHQLRREMLNLVIHGRLV
jgi:hypothetical protein